jgi:hypothetical protein
MMSGASTCKTCVSGSSTLYAGASSDQLCVCGATGSASAANPPTLTPDGVCFYGFWSKNVSLDLDISRLSPHWTLCYEEAYSVPTTLSDLRCSGGGSKCKPAAVCGSGGKVLFGWKKRGGAKLAAAAMGTTRSKTATNEDVVNPVLQQTSEALVHNGVYWYLTEYTFGFSLNPNILLDTQDLASSNCAFRMGWELSGEGGFRAGCTCIYCDGTDLSFSDTASREFVKVIYWAE